MSEWIKCSERLPEIRKHVLTYQADAIMPIKVNYIHNYEGEFAYGASNIITHWMLLPEAPKDDN